MSRFSRSSRSARSRSFQSSGFAVSLSSALCLALNPGRSKPPLEFVESRAEIPQPLGELRRIGVGRLRGRLVRDLAHLAFPRLVSAGVRDRLRFRCSVAASARARCRAAQSPHNPTRRRRRYARRTSVLPRARAAERRPRASPPRRCPSARARASLVDQRGHAGIAARATHVRVSAARSAVIARN